MSENDSDDDHSNNNTYKIQNRSLRHVDGDDKRNNNDYVDVKEYQWKEVKFIGTRKFFGYSLLRRGFCSGKGKPTPVVRL